MHPQRNREAMNAAMTLKKQRTKSTLHINMAEAAQEDVPAQSRTRNHGIKMEMTRKSSFMSTFLEQVDTIQSNIQTLQEATRTIHALQEQALYTATTREENQISQQLTLVVDETNKQAKLTKDLLSRLEQDTETLKRKGKIKDGEERYVVIIDTLGA